MYNINALTYTSKDNPEWFTRAMFGGRLVQGGYIRVLTGIKGDELLSMIDLENKILQIDGKDCAWTPNQIIKLSEKLATVKTYKINLEECIDVLENKRTVYSLSPGAQNEALPSDLEAATLALISIGLSNEIEEMIIGGDSTVDPNQIDGMQKQLIDSDEAVQLVGAVLTKSNVLSAFEAVYGGFSEEMLQSEEQGTAYVFGAYSTRRLIREALTTVTNQTIYQSWSIDDTDKKNPKLYYLGVEFVPVKGIGKNTLIGIASTNALLLTDLMSDLEDIELGQFPKPYDNKVFIKGRLRLGFVIPFEDEAVIWSDLITVASAERDQYKGLRVVPNSLVFAQAGETKTFTILTKTGVTPVVASGGATGYTVTAGTTTAGVTTVTVVAAAAQGKRDPNVAQVLVSLPGDVNRSAVVTLNQANEDIVTITP